MNAKKISDFESMKRDHFFVENVAQCRWRQITVTDNSKDFQTINTSQRAKYTLVNRNSYDEAV